MPELQEKMAREELEPRWRRCREFLVREAPGAGGLLVFSRLNLYWLTGTLASGVLWLPLEHPPVLLCRKGTERARLESPLEGILSFRSYRELPDLLAGSGSPLSPTAGAEMNGLSWALGRTLSGHIPGVALVPADGALSRARAVKSRRELAVMREAGARQARCLEERLPALIRPGMTEEEIAHRVWEVFFAEGHQGLLRMEKFGEEVFLGHISAGDSGNYPSAYNGPLGLRGEHPAVPYMGWAGKTWRKGEILTVDVGFCLGGYLTDKTQVYWAGRPGEMPEKLTAAQAFCAEAHDRLAEGLRPGAVPGELAARCFGMAEEAGWSEGFMGLGGNKVGFLGHGIGLAIDEWPVMAPGFDEPLEEANVLALEPKMGLPGIGMVGIENTVEVTPSGGRVLTGSGRRIICI